MGHDSHVNLVGDPNPCGTLRKQCPHCLEAMKRISVDQAIHEVETAI
jgi:hypothetical protein